MLIRFVKVHLLNALETVLVVVVSAVMGLICPCAHTAMIHP